MDSHFVGKQIILNRTNFFFLFVEGSVTLLHGLLNEWINA